MPNHQIGISADMTPHARYLTFELRRGADASGVARVLRESAGNAGAVVGLGLSLVRALGGEIPGLRPFPRYAGAGLTIPATPADLWVWLRGVDRGELMHRSLEWMGRLADSMVARDVVDGFVHLDSRDLTGYEDGTENPTGDKALATAFVQGAGRGLDGSSFVAVQKWRHDFARFNAMSETEQDDLIGRHKSNNEEFDSAPASAHVKRTAQESFDPEAFVLRRSLPWTDASGAGLVFVAFGHSLDAFEAQLHRMSGEEDGIADGLFQFTRPETGGYFWCPPVAADGTLDLSALPL